MPKYYGGGGGNDRPVTTNSKKRGNADKSGGSSNYGNQRPATTWGNFMERAQSREGTRVPATRNDNTFGNNRGEYSNNLSPTYHK